MWKNRQFLNSSAILIGTMVGLGVFGIPFAFAKAGFWIGLLFLVVIGSITTLLLLMYGEIILRTKKSYQIVGYTNLYLGSGYKKIMFFSAVLGMYGTLLAYIIISGDFLLTLVAPFLFVSSSSLSTWFFVILSLLILTGIKRISLIEFFMTLLFSAIILTIFGFGVSKIDIANYSVSHLEFWFIPYGVMLFAFGGLSSVHIQREALAGKEKWLKKSIYFSVIFTAVLYLIFGFVVLGISGGATSPDAISGLVGALGERIIFLAALFGILAISTSYLAIGTVLHEIFHLDYGLKKFPAWLLTIIPPYVLFLGGLRNFIDVIGLVGSVGVGVAAILIILAFRKAKKMGDRVPEYSISFPMWFLWILITMFAGGVIYQLFVF